MTSERSLQCLMVVCVHQTDKIVIGFFKQYEKQEFNITTYVGWSIRGANMDGSLVRGI